MADDLDDLDALLEEPYKNKIGKEVVLYFICVRSYACDVKRASIKP